MEKSSYARAKFSLEPKEPMPKRDCGFYIKYIFLFTSLIQFLIILGLVLFMVYGNAQGGTDTHLRVLEEQLQDRFNKITILASRNMNLTRTLNATLKEKQGLQVLAQKVQRELEKCNSTQASNPLAKVRPGLGGAATHLWVLEGAGPYCSPTRFGRDGRRWGWAEPDGDVRPAPSARGVLSSGILEPAPPILTLPLLILPSPQLFSTAQGEQSDAGGSLRDTLTSLLFLPPRQLQQMVMIISYQKRKLDECHMTISLINASCSGKGPPHCPPTLPPPGDPQTPLRDPPQPVLGGCPLPRDSRVTPRCGAGVWGGGSRTPIVCPPPTAEKAQLRSQVDQSTLSKKDLEENCRKAGATLTKTTEEQKSCERELMTTKTVCESTKTNLELLKHECGSLRSDMSYSFQRIKDILSPYSCSTVHEQLNWLTQRTEGLFLWQQERETKYVGKSVCDMNLLQCRINCSGEKQELEKRLQDVEKQVEGGQEEKKKLLLEKEQLGKELEEKSKVAVQAGHLREQLSLCMGSKVRELLGCRDIPRHWDSPGHPLWPCWEHVRPDMYIFLFAVAQTPLCTCIFLSHILFDRAFSLAHLSSAHALLQTHFCTCIYFCACNFAHVFSSRLHLSFANFCTHASAEPRGAPQARTSHWSTLGCPSCQH